MKLFQKIQRFIKVQSVVQVSTYVLVLLLFVSSVAAVTHPYWADSRFPYTHDGENHLARFANYKIALKEGQFPPRIGPNLHNRYGYPVFNYNYPLANIISVPFSVLKISYETTFSIQVLLAVSLAWIGVWIIAKKYLQTMLALPSIVASLYVTAPYLSTALFYRGNIGEIWAFALFPWLYITCIWISSYNTNKTKFFNFISTILVLVVWISFLLAHNLAVLISIPMLIVFAGIVFKDSLQSYVRATLIGLFAIGSTLWFWLPALAEKHYITLSDVDLSKQFSTHFLQFDDIFFQAHRFGFSLDGFINSGTPSLGVSILALFVLFSGIVLHQFVHFLYLARAINTTSKEGRQSQIAVTTSVALLATALFSIFMSTKMSSIIWNSIPQLSLVQFPWRWLLITPILIVVGFLTSLGNILTMPHANSKLISYIMLALLLPLFTIQLVALTRYSPADRFTKNIEDYDAFSMTTSTQNENMPVTFSYSNIADWQPSPTILNDNPEKASQISVLTWNGSNRTYTIENSEPILVAEPTMYFPGWKTNITTQSQTLSVDLASSVQKNQDLQGRIGYTLEPGSHTITTQFTQDTWARRVGNTISAICFIVLLIYSGYSVITIVNSNNLKN